MHSNFRIGRRPGSEIVLAGFTILFVLITTRVQAGPPQQTQPAGSATTLTATSTNVSDAGRGVKINILRWSTDEERNALVVAMNPPPPTTTSGVPAGRGGGGGRGGRGAGGRGGRGGATDVAAAPPKPLAAFTAAIEKAPTVGYVWTTDSNIGYAIRYAYRAPMPEGGDRIVIATNRRLGDTDGSWKPVAPVNAPDYDFTVIELRLDARGLGEGKASITTQPVVNAEAKTIVLENYETAPVVLKNVKR